MMTVAYFASAHQPPTDRWFVPAPLYTVRVIRHTHECYEVEAFGFHGQRIRHRMTGTWQRQTYVILGPPVYLVADPTKQPPKETQRTLF